MHLIYGEKTNQSLPKFEFPIGFSLYANSKHYSNTAESIKLTKEIIILYIENQRVLLKLPKTQPSLVIIDVFQGQMTEDVSTVLKDNNILLVQVPANMRHIFQPFDLMVNGTFKTFMRKFSEWYSTQTLHALENGSEVIDIKVDVKLTIMEPLYAKWLSEFYNHISSLDGQEITQNGWLRAGITDAIKMWSSKLPSLNPFLNICSDTDFVVKGNPSQAEFTCPELVNPLDCVPRTLIQSDCDSDW